MLAEPKELLVFIITALLGGGAILALPLSRQWAWLFLALGIPWASEILETTTFTLTLPTDIFAALGGLTIGTYFLLFPEALLPLWKVPILRWVILYLAWMGITTAFSTDVLVSMKFWLSQTAYFGAFGVGGYLWIKESERGKKYETLTYLLLLSAIGVMSLCIIEHIQLGATRTTVNKSIHPFMREHTVYGAYAAWFFVLGIVLFVMQPNILRGVAAVVAGTALFLSYSRGAWLTAIATLGIWAVIEVLRHLSAMMRFLLVATGGLALLVGGLILISYNPDILQLQARQQIGEAGGHLISSFDVKKNPSNMERINRWFSALQMIEERPIFGFGTNTFTQEYSAYQRSLTRTSISVEMGEVGGAHSEYLTAASELGLPGLLLLLGIYGSTLYFGLRGLWRTHDASLRWRYAILTLPLLSYYLHGFINNFMDHGHIAALVYLHWGMLAALQTESVPSRYAEMERA